MKGFMRLRSIHKKESGSMNLEYVVVLAVLFGVLVVGIEAIRASVNNRMEVSAEVEASFIPCSREGELSGDECY